jgi:hypothetical protein
MSASDLVINTFEQAWESFVAEVMNVIRSFNGDIGLGQQFIGILILRNYTTLLNGREELYGLFFQFPLVSLRRLASAAHCSTLQTWWAKCTRIR